MLCGILRMFCQLQLWLSECAADSRENRAGYSFGRRGWAW